MHSISNSIFLIPVFELLFYQNGQKTRIRFQVSCQKICLQELCLKEVSIQEVGIQKISFQTRPSFSRQGCRCLHTCQGPNSSKVCSKKFSEEISIQGHQNQKDRKGLCQEVICQEALCQENPGEERRQKDSQEKRSQIKQEKRREEQQKVISQEIGKKVIQSLFLSLATFQFGFLQNIDHNFYKVEMNMERVQSFKLDEMNIDNKQVFWKMQHCIVLIPIVQLLDGHILIISKRKVAEYSDLEPVEIFDIGLAIRFISKSMESFYSLSATTIHIQNATSESPIKQMMIHIIPRKPNDLKNNDAIYGMLKKYPEELITHYNQKMNFYINAYVNKILEGIHEQAKKYEAHLKLCFKEEKQT